MKVIIAGAGIGGLSLALMLHQRGIDCDVYESVPQLKPLGVGINLLPHASAEMAALGMLDTLEQHAIATSALHYYNQFGQTIWMEPRGRLAGYPVPQLSIHRGTLQVCLAEAFQQRAGSHRLHLGMRLQSVQQKENGVEILFFDQATGQTITRQADCVVGADGIHSALRQQFYPANDPFRYSGRFLWRAVSYGKPYLDGKTMFMAGHQDKKFVAYPIVDENCPEHLVAINWIAELSLPEWEITSTDWNREVNRDVFEGEFSDWRWDWIDIPRLIQSAERIYEFPLIDKDPLPRWSFGSATLLGDAAHPLYPIGSNGSAQAILDARCLADYLQNCDSSIGGIQLALKEYEADRLPATTGIILRNRLNGPEQVMQIAHERAPQGFSHIHDVMTPSELESVATRYKRVAGFDSQTVKAVVASKNT